MAGRGNIVGDEPAMSMVAVESEIKLPPASTMPSPPIACFMAPWQRWTQVDFANLKAKFSCQWAATEIAPEVVHFAGTGKQDGVYRQWLESEAGRA
jgi:hypothetical protein